MNRPAKRLGLDAHDAHVYGGLVLVAVGGAAIAAGLGGVALLAVGVAVTALGLGLLYVAYR